MANPKTDPDDETCGDIVLYINPSSQYLTPRSEESRVEAIDIPVTGAIEGWCYLVPYEGKFKTHTDKKVIGMFIPQNRNGQKKMISVSVMLC